MHEMLLKSEEKEANEKKEGKERKGKNSFFYWEARTHLGEGGGDKSDQVIEGASMTMR